MLVGEWYPNLNLQREIDEWWMGSKKTSVSTIPQKELTKATAPQVASVASIAKNNTFQMDRIIRVSDGNRKVICTNGESWVNSKLSGAGKWISPTRYAVFVESWAGGVWWVGELETGGLVTTCGHFGESELLTVEPKGLEPFCKEEHVTSALLQVASAKLVAYKYVEKETPFKMDCLICVSHGNCKVIRTNGEFWVNDKLLGIGKWISPTRYAVFVESSAPTTRDRVFWNFGSVHHEGMLKGIV
jgi:hypothetical protein